MWWRLKRSEFDKQKGEGNRKGLKSIVDSGEIPGILTYLKSSAVGWCAVAPRERFPALERSRILARVDEKPVWSVVCLFVDKIHRKAGISRELLKGAVDYVKSCGGTIVEGYPVEPRKDRMPDVFAFTGLASAYLKSGFKEVARRSETRPIMRFYIS
jgi:GNAT superfamily N-acetyltransferase